MASKDVVVCCSYRQNENSDYVFRVVKDISNGMFILERLENGKYKRTNLKADVPTKLEKYIWKEFGEVK